MHLVFCFGLVHGDGLALCYFGLSLFSCFFVHGIAYRNQCDVWGRVYQFGLIAGRIFFLRIYVAHLRCMCMAVLDHRQIRKGMGFVRPQACIELDMCMCRVLVRW